MTMKSTEYQALTRNAFKAHAGSVLTVAAAVVVRAAHEGGPSKDFRKTLSAECTLDGVPDGTFKPVYAAVARWFDKLKGAVVPDASPADQQAAMVKVMVEQFKTASAFLAARTEEETANAKARAQARAEQQAESAAASAAEAATMQGPAPDMLPATVEDVIRYLSGANLTSEEAMRVVSAMVPSLARVHVEQTGQLLAQRLTELDLIASHADEIAADLVSEIDASREALAA